METNNTPSFPSSNCAVGYHENCSGANCNCACHPVIRVPIDLIPSRLYWHPDRDSTTDKRHNETLQERQKRMRLERSARMRAHYKSRTKAYKEAYLHMLSTMNPDGVIQNAPQYRSDKNRYEQLKERARRFKGIVDAKR